MNKPQHLMFLVALLVAGSAVAQSEPQVAPQYTEEIEVRVIDIDVVVTDRKGNRLTNLKREDFELYEDRKRVDIDYFSRIAGGRIADVPVPAVGTPDVVGPARQQQPRIPLTWVIFIDHTNLAPQTRNHGMRQLQVFLQRAITRGDRGVIALNDGRSFRIRQGITDDPTLLMATLAKMEKERVPVSPTRNRAGMILNQMRRTEADFGNVQRPGRGLVRDETRYMALTAGNEISAVIEEEALRTKRAIMAMSALLDSLAQLEGRLALVYVGAGFNTLPAADLTATWRSRYKDLGAQGEPHPEEQTQSIQREITRLYDNLSALRVTVYTIHGGEMGGGPTSVEDSGSFETGNASTTDIAELTEAGNARELAQRTGGLFFRINPGLAGQLDVVVRDLDDYYSLGYRPTGPPGDTRRIRVKVNVDGARVRHRETVRERTRTEKATGAVVASMVQPQPRMVQKVRTREPLIPPAVATAANPLGVSIEADRPTKRHGWEAEHLLNFNFSINLEALTFVKWNNGYRSDFVMHFALVGEDGAVYPLESREQALTVPAADLEAASGNLVAYTWHVDVTPLRISEDIPANQKGLRLTVTVEDSVSRTRSVVTVPLGKEKQNRG